MRNEGLTVLLNPDQVIGYMLDLLKAGATPEAQGKAPTPPG
jgi:hypothetical protein